MKMITLELSNIGLRSSIVLLSEHLKDFSSTIQHRYFLNDILNNTSLIPKTKIFLYFAVNLSM